MLSIDGAPARPHGGAKLGASYFKDRLNSIQAIGADGEVEISLAKVKARLKRDWHPEYEPEAILPPHLLDGDHTLSERATLISLQDIVSFETLCRKTKIVCTLGPACSTQEGMTALLDAGLNIARMNFSHGDHGAHAQTLQTFRCATFTFCRGHLRAKSDQWHRAPLSSCGLLMPTKLLR